MIGTNPSGGNSSISQPAAGGARAVWPLIDSLSPDADTIARFPVSYDLREVRTGGPT
jgi:hypothetical protein